jgi:hypothetical protein
MQRANFNIASCGDDDAAFDGDEPPQAVRARLALLASSAKAARDLICIVAPSGWCRHYAGRT